MNTTANTSATPATSKKSRTGAKPADTRSAEQKAADKVTRARKPAAPKSAAKPKKADAVQPDPVMTAPTVEADKPVDMEKILDRVKKLLSMANDERGNINEVSTAATMAANMMAKYNLSMADVIETEISGGGGVVQEDMVNYGFKNRFPAYFISTAIAVAKAFDCHVRYVRKTLDEKYKDFAHIQIYGYKTDVVVAKWVLQYVIDRMHALANDYWAAEGAELKAHNITAQSAKTSYVLGLASTIRDTLAKYKAEQAEVKCSDGRGLVVVKEHAITETFGKFEYTENNGIDVLASAHRAGIADGKKISLHTVIESGKEEAAQIGQ